MRVYTDHIHTPHIHMRKNTQLPPPSPTLATVRVGDGGGDFY